MAADLARQRLIRLIHVGRRDLAMDDDTYRAMLRNLELPDSAAKMTVPQLDRVLERMKRSGFKVRSKGKSARASSSRPLAQDPESKKIRALWLFLHDLGVVKNPSEAALAGYVKRLAGVDAMQWTNAHQAERLIETLKKWAMRFLPQAIRTLAQEVSTLPLTDVERLQLNGALSTAFTRGTFDPMHAAWELLVDLKGRAAR